MKVIIVGAGASGVTAAINYKRNHADDEVLIIEHLDKPLKKILATGNGKCNLGNAKLDYSRYNNPEFVEKITANYDYVEFFNSISIKTKLIDDLAYPVSESAVSVREALLKETAKLGIKIDIENELVDYKVDKVITVKTKKADYVCDKLILAGGLKSSPKLGTDGSLLKVLEKHGYEIINPEPGLSPLFTKEKTKIIDGIRVKSQVELKKEGKSIHKENGEVLFKDHGLSGIVIFNTMSLIARKSVSKYEIIIDLLPDHTQQELNSYLREHSFDELMLAYINPKLVTYLKDRYQTNSEVLKHLKHLEFTFDHSYGFEFSQVSVGGVSTTEVDENLMSKKEKGVYLVGELLNIDGPCGGYNLTWAFASAIKATK